MGDRICISSDGGAVSLEIFSTFDQKALAALRTRDVPRVRAADYFSKTASADAEADQALARWDAYFAQFAKLTDGACLCCGKSLRCYLGMGFFGGFAWDMVHGEGHCTYCGYPMRGHHRVDGLGTIRNLFLPYHPSMIAFPPKEAL
jgi:hypothetical protein